VIKHKAEKFAHDLAEIFDAEHQFLEVQQLMLIYATDQGLKDVVEEHMTETEGHIRKLEEVFVEVGKEPKREPCGGAQGLAEEASKLMEDAGTDPIRDMFIVGCALKAEHYEMVSYVDLIDGAESLDLRNAVRLLTQNRTQELRAARRLEGISVRLGKMAA
jgi:ferritin-like metal-binding protein YciE